MKLYPFINKYYQHGINFPIEKDDLVEFEKKVEKLAITP